MKLTEMPIESPNEFLMKSIWGEVFDAREVAVIGAVLHNSFGYYFEISRYDWKNKKFLDKAIVTQSKIPESLKTLPLRDAMLCMRGHFIQTYAEVGVTFENNLHKSSCPSMFHKIFRFLRW